MICGICEHRFLPLYIIGGVMRKRIKLALAATLLLLSLCALFGCDFEGELPWEPVEVTVYDNYSNADPDIYTLVDTTSISLSVPGRKGYVFAGYYDSSSGGIQIIDAYGTPNIVITKSITLYAQWEPNTYSIRFNADGGQVLSSSDTASYKYGSSLSSFPVAEREGYDFMGWASGGVMYSDSNGIVLDGFTDFVDGDKYGIFSNDGVTLQAVWERHQLTVTFDYYDGSYTTETFKVYYGDSFPLSKFPSSDTGAKEIAGWSYSTGSGELIDTDISNIKSDITVYAVWREYKLVKFVELNDSFRMIKVYADTPYDPYVPEYDGYSFDGWYTSTTFAGNPIGIIQYYEAKDVYYARLDIVTYSVNFSVSNNYGSDLSPVKYTVHDSVQLPRLAGKSGHVFVGWCKSADLSDEAIWEISAGNTSDMVLYDKWFNIEGNYAYPNWSVSTTTKSNATTISANKNGYYINIPTELKRYVEEGRLSISIEAALYYGVKSMGNATGQCNVELYIKGSSVGSGSVSAKGGGYSGFIVTSPKDGSWAYRTSYLGDVVSVNDMSPIAVGYGYYMTSDRENSKVYTSLSYSCNYLYYRFVVN